MNFQRLDGRLKKLERRLSPPDDGTITLTELYRAMWRASKSDCLRLARETGVGFLIDRFEREDAEQDQAVRRRVDPRGRR